jgi:hypothetical protein
VGLTGAARVAGVLIVASAVMLIAPAAAGAVSSAVCDQYPDVPQCQGDGGASGGGNPGGEPGDAAGGGGDQGSEATPDAPASAGSIPGAGAATGASDSAGELPFTGYPLSPLVMAMLILLAAALTIRILLAAGRWKTTG